MNDLREFLRNVKDLSSTDCTEYFMTLSSADVLPEQEADKVTLMCYVLARRGMLKKMDDVIEAYCPLLNGLIDMMPDWMKEVVG